jgi:RNA polymerase sigma factor (sigma-70 family)
MRKTLPKRSSLRRTNVSRSCEIAILSEGGLGRLPQIFRLTTSTVTEPGGVFFSEEPVEIATEIERENDRQEMLELAIRKLPDAQRVSLVLFHFQDMSYEEIAAKLGVTLAKVKSDIHRGRETLKKLITK